MQLFDTFKIVTKDQTAYYKLDDEFRKAYAPFMVNRFCSSVASYVIPIACIDRYRISDEAHYTYLTSFIPKKDHYLNYKAYKKSKTGFEEAIPLVCKYFEIGPREAKEYIELMSDSELDEIVKLYSTR